MNTKVIDMVGDVCGRLTVLSRANKPANVKTDKAYWLCKCVCGKEKVVSGDELRSGGTKSCGCLIYKSRGKTHGLRYHHLYATWYGMMQRCYNPSRENYLDYGGSGIKVCERWHSVENFIGDMETSWRKGLTLERIDNDGDYESSNCRWATALEQASNKRPKFLLKHAYENIKNQNRCS